MKPAVAKASSIELTIDTTGSYHADDLGPDQEDNRNSNSGNDH